MGRKSKQLRNFTTGQVEALFESDSDFLTGVKILAIIQLCKGYSSRKLSEFYGVSFKQICNRADRFDAEGIQGLRLKPGRGRHSFLTESQTLELNTPSHAQCVASHHERNLSGFLLEKLQNRDLMVNLPKIEPKFYLDPMKVLD